MRISVITATYNSAATIHDTLESMLRQTYKEIEYLIVDGASTDETMQIVRSYEPLFEGKMRIVSEPDFGIYDAMNKGIARATGDVVGLLNSDDFYTTDDVLERVAQAAEEPDLDAVYGDVHYVDASNLMRPVRYYSSANFTPERMRMGFMPAHPSFYCKRDCYKDFGTFDTSYKVAADFEHLLRLIYVHRISTRYLPFDFVTMRMGGASSSGFASHRCIMADHHRALKANGVKSSYFRLALRYFFKVKEIVLYRLFGSRE